MAQVTEFIKCVKQEVVNNMELEIFGIDTIVIECVFIDSRGRDVSIHFILNENETSKLASSYVEHAANMSMKDWIACEIHNVVTIEEVKNFLNGLDIESQMEISILD